MTLPVRGFSSLIRRSDSLARDRAKALGHFCVRRQPARLVFAGLVFALPTLAGLAGCGLPKQSPPNVILLSIDTLRADRLGCYGYDRDTSPTLDALAARGIRFETVVAPSPWTLPSHVTMLSGLDPSAHGVVLPSLGIAPDTPLLAQMLHDAGYQTLGLTDGGYVSARHGFDRGFDEFSDESSGLVLKLDRVLAALEGRDRQSPLFAFVHTYEVHCPYDPADAFKGTMTSAESEFIETQGLCGNPHFNSMDLTPGQIRFLSDRYDESIRGVDADLGVFLKKLELGGWMSNTILIITSDHGEEFGEHGRIGHERSLHREVLLVPWIAAGGQLDPRRVSNPVPLADLTPAVLDWTGVRPRPGPIETTAARPIFSELHWQARLVSLFLRDEHLILDLDEHEMSLYHWKEDPSERADRADDRPDLVRTMLPEVRRYQSRAELAQAARTGGVTPEHAERLRSLGYAQ